MLVITRSHREGNNRWEANCSTTYFNTLCLKTVALDKNPFQIAVVDMDGSNAYTWVSPVCTDLLQTAEVNQQSNSAFCLSSQPSVESSGLIWREYWQSVCSLIGLREQSIQMCLLCPFGSNFEKDQDGLKPSDRSLNGLLVQGLLFHKQCAHWSSLRCYLLMKLSKLSINSFTNFPVKYFIFTRSRYEFNHSSRTNCWAPNASLILAN